MKTKKQNLPPGLAIRDGSYRIRKQIKGKRLDEVIARVEVMTQQQAIEAYYLYIEDIKNRGLAAAKLGRERLYSNSDNITLADIFHQFIERAGTYGTDKTGHKPLSEKNIKNHKSAFKQPRLDTIRNMKITEIDASVLRDWYVAQRFKHPAELGALDNLRRMMSSWFRQAVADGLISQNPLTGSDAWASKNLHQFRTERIESNDSDELSRFVRALVTYREKMYFVTNKTSRYATFAYLMTGLRQDELLTTKWSDVRFDDQYWFRPKELMKAKSRDHYVGLNTALVTMFRQLEREQRDNGVYDPSGYVFLGKNQKDRMKSNVTTIQNITQLAGIGKTIRSHDIRRTNQDMVNRVTEDERERQILRSHGPASVTDRYGDWKLETARLNTLYQRMFQDDLSVKVNGTRKFFDVEKEEDQQFDRGDRWILEPLLFRDLWRDGEWVCNAIWHNDDRKYVSYPSELWEMWWLITCTDFDTSLEDAEKEEIFRVWERTSEDVEFPTYGRTINRNNLRDKKREYEKECGFNLTTFYRTFVFGEGNIFEKSKYFDPPESGEDPLLGFKNEEGYVINKGESEPKTDQLSLF